MKNNIFIDHEKIEEIYQEKPCGTIKIFLENGDCLSRKECKNKKISFFCSICKKEICKNYSNYKLSEWANKENLICNSCEQKNNPRIHIWTDDEREIRKKIYSGEKNPFYGKKHTEEAKQKIKEKRKHQIITEEVKQKISKYWKENPDKKIEAVNKALQTKSNWTEEEKIIHHNNLIAGAQKAKNSPNYLENKRKAAKKSRLSQDGYKMNKFEKKIDNWLNEHNIQHNYSVTFSDDTNTYQFDFGIKNKKILIECHGTYWHGDCRFFDEFGKNGKRILNEIQKEKQKTDKLKEKFAKKHNFKLIIVWEYDIVINEDFSKLEEVLL